MFKKFSCVKKSLLNLFQGSFCVAISSVSVRVVRDSWLVVEKNGEGLINEGQ